MGKKFLCQVFLALATGEFGEDLCFCLDRFGIYIHDINVMNASV